MPQYLTVEQAHEELLGLARSGRPHCISLLGPPAAGRGYVLDAFAADMAALGRPVARLELPDEGLDAPAIGLIQACSYLDDLHGLCRDRAIPFEKKVSRVSETLAPNAVVVVYAAGVGRRPGASPASDRVGGRVADMIDALSDDRLTVVAGGKWLQVPRRSKTLRLIKWAPSKEWIKAGFSGTMADAVARLDPVSYAGSSRLELRLAAALLCLGKPQGEIEMLLSFRLIESLIDALWDQVNKADDALTRAWSQLSVARGRITHSLHAGFLSGLGPKSKNIFDEGITYAREDEIVLHERLRRVAASALRCDRSAWSQVQRQHAALWRAATARAFEKKDVWQALEAESHFAHHLGESGGPLADLEDHLHFQDQYCALGRTLSKRYERFGEAAACFRRAVELDPDDAYAHHYRAYNLERDDGEPGTITEEYLRAIDLDRSNVWWHQRYVGWCINRGRAADARAAWTRALDETEEYRDSNYEPDPDYFENLHKMVLARALTRDLPLAHAVIADIPDAIVEESADLHRQVRAASVLEQSERDGLVYPLHILLDSPWIELWDSPVILPAQVGSPHKKRVRWFAARIDAISDREVHFLGGAPTADGSRLFRGALPRARFDAATKDETAGQLERGRYFEAGEYGLDNELVIRVHPARPTTWHKLQERVRD